ncbi:bifunctional DNA primase/polymerase [Streptomyces turgidiscabies]|uniref:bifunctional DNA primase/polymerase n=1 Tax=Streptomyces turgidiscabies TaxID=85558 RepID=UPI0038F631BC
MPARSDNYTPRPYFEGVAIYARYGHDGIIPIVPGTKQPAESGCTGRYPQLSARESVQRAHLYPAHNLALRLPANYIGIDVDAYDGRGGDKTLRRLEAKHGKLPTGPISTSRSDGVSGIRLFRTRTQERLVNSPGPGIEIVQRHHRFVMCWPSIHPRTRAQYTWQNTAELVPFADEIPILPLRWEKALRAPRRRTSVPAPTGPLPSREAASESLLRHIRAVAAELAALPKGSAANGPCNDAALKLSSYAPHDVSADVIRAELRRGVDAWQDGHDRGYLAIDQGLSVIGTERHEPRPWTDSEGAGFALIKEAGK